MNLEKKTSNPEVKNTTQSKIDFFLSPQILKLGKSHPRVKMFFGDRIQNIDKAKKAQKIYKKECEWLVKIIKEKI